MDPPSPSLASQTQPAAPSPLTSYHWHSGGCGEKGAGGFRWGRLAGWGRALSHQEPTHLLLYPEPEPELEPPAPQIPEAPPPDVPVWNIGAFTLLDGRLVLLGGEEEHPRRPRVGSASSEGSIQVALGNLRDPDRTSGKTEPEAAGPNQVHNIRGLLKRLKEKKKAKSELGANASQDGLLEEPHCFQALVTDLGTAELARSGGREALLFRENTLATKAIDEYMKLVAQDYLQKTLGQVVRRLCASTEDCEVNPSKCPASELPQRQIRLRNSCKEVFENIIHSCDWFPAELGTVFSGWREACKARGSEALGPRLVCASLFLRLLCPAILSPSLFGLAPEHPAPGPARTLTLIAKVIQNLANHAPFGEKEAYMSFMNSFLEDHGPAMQRFLDQVAMVDVHTAPSGYQGSSDLALQLAVLHAQLCTIFAELDQATRDSLEPLPTILGAIEEGRPVPVSVPMRLPPPLVQVHSSRRFPGSASWTSHGTETKRWAPTDPWARTAKLDPERDPPTNEGHRLKSLVRPLPEPWGISGLGEGTRVGCKRPLALSPLPLPPQECRLAEIESTQAQLKESIQSLQLLPRTSGSQSQPLPLKAPCINGDTT
ncbi:hypothetical protein E2I00_005730 [Balaenoptera physalus]|uniref:RAS protein activator like-3 n=1 Tax=Balaenoptera physalus TaxID=9770 RepID=A0A643C594_BALPH|nr:hypothetical protein E2I00_005730 [Balaenoptera physalus]